jgi:hypothetical protein
MLAPFFTVAMVAPNRQATFRRAVVAHVLLLTLAAWLLTDPTRANGMVTFAYLCLGAAMVEAAALVGWRLTQMPKSQALEFMLVSPVQPKRVFLAEALVGLARFAFVWLSGLPVFVGLLIAGRVGREDAIPLLVLPFAWGLAVSMGLTAWVYESIRIRRVGEILGLVGVLAYLTIGVLAAENLVVWLRRLPVGVAQLLYDGVIFLHTMNPFGVVRYWFTPSECIDWIATERATWLIAGGIAASVVFAWRASCRMTGHFQARHYQVKGARHDRDTGEQRFAMRLFPISFQQKPLSWWAVKRVMEYSGRINLWLAGGFSVLYAAYIVAGDDWPQWMGRLVFQIFEQWGGAPTVATAMAVMAMVPAIFQFGLWDASTQDRCKRLELLLLTELEGRDYFHASLAASWRRGRGYLCIAIMLWIALAVGGRISIPAALAATAGGFVLWAFGFAVGFRAFSTGHQTSGLSSLIVLGMPLLLLGLMRAGAVDLAAMLPVGLCHVPASAGLHAGWFAGMFITSLGTGWLIHSGLKFADRDLRKWYDANQGTVVQ